jgi:protein-tyrosine kinase
VADARIQKDFQRMSRIDKALRVWEESAGLARPNEEATDLAEKTTLGEYAREARPSSGHTTSPEPPQHRPIVPAPAVRRPSPADHDSEARLVTGRLSGVSLEQYRRLAAALHDAQLEGGLKTVMLTSAVPDEGKTLTVVNLALTLSESYDRRVLIIDADLRRPNVHSLLRVPNTHGLTEALADEHLELPFVEISERLSVLTAGRPGPAPLARLTSPRMQTLLEECSRRFDWVLLDTPPVGILTDAQLLARVAGAVVLVISAGSTPATVVERTIAELGVERIIGTVLNRVEAHALSDARYYEQYLAAD